MGANIFVDPVIVATPAEGTDRVGVEAWLTNLETWLKEALTAHFTWLHSTLLTELLDEHHRFPSFEYLRTLQRRYRLDINPALLARHVHTFFRDPSFDLESTLESLGYLAESKDGSVVLCPTYVPDRWPPFLCPGLHALLVLCAVCKQTGHPFTGIFRIATLKCPDNGREITVSATLTSTLPEIAELPEGVITQTFPLIFAPEDLLPLIDVQEFWHTGDEGFVVAIEQQCRKDWCSGENVVLFCRTGSHFRASIVGAGLDTNEMVLRKIVRLAAAVIAGQVHHIDGARLHPLRTTTAGNSPQRTREKDQARAWRLDLTTHGAGWRLHYWHIPSPDGGAIELSNVCKESDVTIYE